MNITVVGIGYVGLSLAVMLSSRNKVIALDVNQTRVDLLNQKVSPIQDQGIQSWLKAKELNLRATEDKQEAYADPEFVIVAAPTNYDDQTHRFDTSIVDSVLDDVSKFAPKATIIIKSTIPVGYTESVQEKYPNTILFSPEFLRETKALEDNLNPSRIIVGFDKNDAEAKQKASVFADLLAQCAEKKDVPILLTGTKEAEAIKLFSNTYLALRVAYFNELDTYALYHGLSSKEIIEGVCLDPRIQGHYNNPSFGYGGYCLPKDTKQLLHNFESVPQNLIEAIVKSNATRKEAMADEILKEAKKRSTSPCIGIYRLTMKTGSDNFRQSAILGVVALLRAENADLCIYEPTYEEDAYQGIPVIHDLSAFKEKTDIIVANRLNSSLGDVLEKVFTRDLFQRD